ncbi:MAG: hypothetical protein JNM30_04820 [Rhodospirillales bacterium]|nr:hypothetical protein [Rhodospirillales bacterium]
MTHEPENTAQDPRRMVPKWTVRHGRLSLAWAVSKPPAPRPKPARAPMPPADTWREAAE